MIIREEKLSKVIGRLEEETRMVLPGIQALFGFQLIAVFKDRFAELSNQDQLFHFAALICTAIAMLLVLTPAAYHRQAEPKGISTFLCHMGSVLLTVSLIPLAVGMCLDLYIIADIILQDKMLSAQVAGAMFICFILAWFVFPQLYKRRRRSTY